MRSLSPLERSIMSRHPDELRGNVQVLMFLAQPGNAGFLDEYRATWADVIAPRRANQSLSLVSTPPCSLSSSSPS